ncbi:MAG: hypothetical protein ACM31O_01610 [Bacteroidota bacterium]
MPITERRRLINFAEMDTSTTDYTATIAAFSGTRGVCDFHDASNPSYLWTQWADQLGARKASTDI